ncbi:DUF4352 domain-containing protein [Clostridium felsineum]|uniref:DUF4352 domain-containing protein n=1 Tax=Clostridium felsineum TaxID=36839 RepID=UPI00098CB3A3|nr:DUF4352 domain-containing protein [Clostridium felsineum]URZ15345.1 hypothetical protein CLFE_013630 [Clostridium felsineum DSM 794]
MNKKEKVILAVVAVVLVLLLGIAIGDKGSNSKEASNNKNQTQNNKNSSKATASNSTQDSKSKIYKLGEDGQINGWSIKVLDVQETNTISAGEGEPNITTQQKFIKIKLQMTNKTQSPKQYSNGNFLLGNMKDSKKYQLNSDAGLKLNEVETIDNKNSGFFLMYDDLNPETPKQTYLVFEVPTSFNISDGVLVAGDDKNTAGYYLK